MYNPKEIGVDKSVPWKTLSGIGSTRHGVVQVEGSGLRFLAGLLLPAAARSTPGRFDDIDIVHVLSEGFGLLMPNSQRTRFHPGAQIGTLQLLPYIEADNVHRKQVGSVRGWRVNGMAVKSGQDRGFDYEVWNQPVNGIIAVLIAL